MRKNEKLIKSLFLFKFKDIRKRLESVRALSNKRLPNEKKNQKQRFNKMLRSVMKEETWKKTPSEDFHEVFHEVRRLGA